MIDDSGSNHVHIDIDNTAQKVFALFDNRCVITVLPESTLSVLALVVLLACSASHKLNRLGDVLLAEIIVDDQVDMIGRHGVVEDGQFVAFFGLIKPL